MAAATKKRTQPPVNPNESKAQKFTRLANKRVNTALAKIRLIGNLGTSQYESTPEQIGLILKVLENEVLMVGKAFTKTKADKDLFEL